MPPGIPHAVLNVTDCVAEGGHMFLRPALRKSLEIGLREHHLGHQDTNASHIGSEVVLHAIWLYYYLGIIALHPAVKGCLEKVTGMSKLRFRIYKHISNSLKGASRPYPFQQSKVPFWISLNWRNWQPSYACAPIHSCWSRHQSRARNPSSVQSLYMTSARNAASELRRC